MRKRKKGGAKSRSRRGALRLGLVLTSFLVLWGCAGEWFVHHPRSWHAEKRASWPSFVRSALFWIGNPLADVTDGLGWTGHDVVYDIDEAPPADGVFFAGAPVRRGAPAPADLVVLDRGSFKIGWSNSLRHPVWCAYRVAKTARHDVGKRPGFTRDPSLPAAPRPDDYARSGYDRGHMVPNYAIVTRYGEAAQKKTFAMSNVAPQSPALNRGVWRDLEHRIADLWTARYGDIWVVVGCLPSKDGERLSGTSIDVPSQFYQVILAQEGTDVRALAVLFPQDIPWRSWAARNIISIDELEELTGLDFNPDMPGFIQDPLEAETPSRLWPVRFRDILDQVLLRFQY